MAPINTTSREKSPKKIIAELVALLDTELPVIVVGHHPLETYGPHGGFFDWKSHLFPARDIKGWLWVPVPIFGAAYPYWRKYWYKSDQDIRGRAEQEYGGSAEQRIVYPEVYQPQPTAFSLCFWGMNILCKS